MGQDIIENYCKMLKNVKLVVGLTEICSGKGACKLSSGYQTLVMKDVIPAGYKYL